MAEWESLNISEGERKAWNALERLDPETVSAYAAVSFDHDQGSYHMESFGYPVTVSLRTRSVSCAPLCDRLLLSNLGHFFRPSAVWYLISARDIPCTGRLVSLEHTKGGRIFSHGSHVLPLDELASHYDRDKERFIRRGREFGGEVLGYGDASLRLRPFPRVPAVLSLWVSDEEFPARAQILFDSTCEHQLPPDVLWSVAMTCVLLFL